MFAASGSPRSCHRASSSLKAKSWPSRLCENEVDEDGCVIDCDTIDYREYGIEDYRQEERE